MRYADDEGLSESRCGNRRQALVSHYRAQQKQLSGQLEYPCEYPYSHSHSVGHMKSSEESPNKPHKCTKEVTHAAPLGGGTGILAGFATSSGRELKRGRRERGVVSACIKPG